MAGPLGSAPGIILATGLGAAAATALDPIVEPARQKAWSNNAFRVNDPATYAALVAQGGIDLSDGRALAKLHGFDSDKFDPLVYLAQRAPTYGEAQDLRRRDKISRDQLFHSFAKAQIERQYWDALADLVDERLSAQVMALAIVRGLVTDPGILPVGPPTTVGKVPAFPVFNIDAVTESAASGIDLERLKVLVGISGRPAPPNEAARAVFRSYIERVDFDRAIAEGDLRNEWADTLFEVAREILTAGQYAELQLRGFLTQPERRAETDKHGMSHADSDLLYNLLGRSIPAHQITTGLARGGVFEGPIDTIPKEYLQSLQRGNLRPEYYNLAFHNRYSYPTGFQVKAETVAGDIPQAECEQLLLELGWSPKWALFFSTKWAEKAGGAALNPWVKAQQTRLVTALHKAAVKTGVPRLSLEQYLEPLVPDLGDRDAIFQLWADEKAVDALTGV